MFDFIFETSGKLFSTNQQQVVAMVSSFAISMIFLVLGKNGIQISTHKALLITIAFSTLCWLLTAFFGPPTDRRVLVEFYKKVRPFGPGWGTVRQEAGISLAESRSSHENIPLGLLGWLSGSVMIWSSLARVDLLALALSLLALYVLVKQGLQYKALLLCAILLFLAIFTRQSYLLAAPLTALVLIWRYDRRRAVVFSLILAIFICGCF